MHDHDGGPRPGVGGVQKKGNVVLLGLMAGTQDGLGPHEGGLSESQEGHVVCEDGNHGQG